MFIGRSREWLPDIAQTKESAMSKRPISGQYKFNLDTGRVYLVASEATESPNLERQANLLQWGEDKEKLERWQRDGKEKG
jgi:hypothetical protein